MKKLLFVLFIAIVFSVTACQYHLGNGVKGFPMEQKGYNLEWHF